MWIDDSTPILAILGTSGQARETLSIAIDIQQRTHNWSGIGFIAASHHEEVASISGFEVLGDDNWLLQQLRHIDITIGIGRPSIRRRLADTLLHNCKRFGYPNLVHPSAITSPIGVTLGRANLVGPLAVLGIDLKMGDFNVINASATIGHEATIGSYCVINPGANIAGNVQISDEVLVGTGVQILEGLSIGEGAIIGAGAVVTTSVDATDTVVGIPARSVKK